jgi:hypothetical protein
MINNSIGKKSENDDKNQDVQQKKPNENNGVYLSSHVKIYDPNTKEIFVQKRADD